MFVVTTRFLFVRYYIDVFRDFIPARLSSGTG